MRVLLPICLLLFCAGPQVAQDPGPRNDPPPNDVIETVDFCELIANPANYEGKTVRTSAIYAYGGEDFTALYCPQCYRKGTLRPDFTESFLTNTPSKISDTFSRQKQSSGTVKVVVVGKVDAHRFSIDTVEKATYISKEFAFPDKLSLKVNGKVNCADPRIARLTGEILKHEVEEAPSTFFVRMTIRFEILNPSDRPVYLLRRDDLVFIGLDISRRSQFDTDSMIESYRGGPSIDVSNKWKLLKKELDQAAPSERVLRRIDPQETWQFETEITLVADKKADKNARLTSSDLRSPIWFIVNFETWSANIARKSKGDSSADAFGQKLQSRFARFGHLLIEDLASDPIQLLPGDL